MRLKGLKYSVTSVSGSSEPRRGLRYVRITAVDNLGRSDIAIVNISLILDNNLPPVLTSDRSVVTYVEGSGSQLVGAGIRLSDGDDNSQFLMENATVTLSGSLNVDEVIRVQGSGGEISVYYGKCLILTACVTLCDDAVVVVVSS